MRSENYKRAKALQLLANNNKIYDDSTIQMATEQNH